MKHGNKAKEVRIALLGSGFVADFYMQGLANVNGHRRRSPEGGASPPARPTSVRSWLATTWTCS